jgi:hypothetical protein
MGKKYSWVGSSLVPFSCVGEGRNGQHIHSPPFLSYLLYFPSPTTQGKVMGSLAGWVLAHARDGTRDMGQPSENFVILILTSVTQSFLHITI